MPVVMCVQCRRLTPSTRSGRCPSCARLLRRRIDASPVRRARKARLYDADHVALRALCAPLVAAGLVRCWRCGRLIVGAFDLGHRPGQLSAPEHPACNRSAR